MTIELYEVPAVESAEAMQSPISSTSGELPDQEPEINLGDLLGSFDSPEAAIAFLEKQMAQQHQQLTDSHMATYDAYTQVSLLTVTVQGQDQSTRQQQYYLLTDEGY